MAMRCRQVTYPSISRSKNAPRMSRVVAYSRYWAELIDVYGSSLVGYWLIVPLPATVRA
jgi:hypothetical protein